MSKEFVFLHLGSKVSKSFNLTIGACLFTIDYRSRKIVLSTSRFELSSLLPPEDSESAFARRCSWTFRRSFRRKRLFFSLCGVRVLMQRKIDSWLESISKSPSEYTDSLRRVCLLWCCSFSATEIGIECTMGYALGVVEEFLDLTTRL